MQLLIPGQQQQQQQQQQQNYQNFIKFIKLYLDICNISAICKLRFAIH